MTEYLAMFWAFVKVGFTSFGGLSMIPLINAEMVSHGWMTSAEVADIVAIAEDLGLHPRLRHLRRWLRKVRKHDRKQPYGPAIWLLFSFRKERPKGGYD